MITSCAEATIQFAKIASGTFGHDAGNWSSPVDSPCRLHDGCPRALGVLAVDPWYAEDNRFGRYPQGNGQGVRDQVQVQAGEFVKPGNERSLVASIK